SILLSPRDSYEGATVAVGFIAAIYLLTDRETRQGPSAVLVVAVMITTVYTCVYLTTSITTALRARERERARLTEELAARAEALRRAYDEIEETRKLELRYMRKVAHELRSPLAAAISSLQVVGLGMAGELAERQAQMVGRVETRMRQLLKTVDDLLLLARERARANAVAGPGDLVSLAAVIGAVVELLEARAQASGVALATDLPPDLPAIRADREALTQVFTNLIGNGIKYTPEGGAVRVSARAEDGAVAVCVADTGIGIPAEDVPRVFEEFFRASNARSHAAVGTGLGLAIARSAVEALGGSIRVSSQEGVGTQFTVTLPIEPSQGPLAVSGLAPSPPE
ncbi:MAG TPA: HAMP domain-containing sensor histidine kinase, partial [Armatimonadota bacterium]|nr:HAMP domain-containing sensor histidine kinase [Armatimonadota bacterium]